MYNAFSEKEIAKQYRQFNKKPFNIDHLFLEADNRPITQNYIFFILHLNEYLTLQKNTEVKDELVSKLIADRLIQIKFKKPSQYDLETLILTLKRALLIISGIYVYYEFTLKGRSCLGLEEIRDRVFDEERKYLYEEINIMKSKSDKQEIERLLHIKKTQQIITLFRKELDWMINNRGYTPFFYFAANVIINELNEELGLPKTKICYLVAEVFAYVKLIPKRNLANYPDSFYNQLKRRAKFEEIESIKFLLTKLSEAIASL